MIWPRVRQSRVRRLGAAALVAAIVVPLLQPRAESSFAPLASSSLLAPVSAPVGAVAAERSGTIAWLAMSREMVVDEATLRLTRDRRAGKVFRAGDGVTLPEVVYEVKPEYTPEAMRRKIQGSVFMLVIVRESGSVGDVQVSGSLDAEYGLDQEAVKAAKQWIFRPGMKDGKAVAVEVTVQMTFTLRK